MQIVEKQSHTSLRYQVNEALFELFLSGMGAEDSRSQFETIYDKGDYIYIPDQGSDKVYFIEQGKIKIGGHSNNGKDNIKAILHSGEYFGELALVGELTRRDFAQAMEANTKVYAMKLSDLQRLQRESREFDKKISFLIGQRLRRAEKKLESLVFKDARSRIVEYIKDLAIEKGRRVGDELLVNHFLTHNEIAQLTGTSRQTVTTVLNELRDKNLIYFDRKRLLVRDESKLI